MGLLYNIARSYIIIEACICISGKAVLPVMLQSSCAQECGGEDSHDTSRPGPGGHCIATPLQALTEVVGTRDIVKHSSYMYVVHK